MTRRNGRNGRKYNRLGSPRINPTPLGLNLNVSSVAAFGSKLIITGSDLLTLPDPANNYYQVRVKMASGVTTSGNMESLSRTNSKIRMRVRPDVFEWREAGPGSALVKVKNMRRLVAISPVDSIDEKIIHPGSTFEPAPGGNYIPPGRKRSRRSSLRRRSRTRR